MNEQITSITYISFNKVDKLWVNNQNEIHKGVSKRQSVFYLISVLTAKKCKELERLESCKWRKKGREEGHLFMGRTDKGGLKHQSPCSPTAHSSGPANVEGKKERLSLEASVVPSTSNSSHKIYEVYGLLLFCLFFFS